MKGKIRKAGFDENFLKCAGAPKGSQIIMTGEKAGIGKGCSSSYWFFAKGNYVFPRESR